MIGNKCGKVKVDQNNWCGNFLFGTEKDQFVDRRAVVGWSWEPPLFSSNLQIHKRYRASHFCRGVPANGEMARKWPKNDNVQKWP